MVVLMWARLGLVALLFLSLTSEARAQYDPGRAEAPKPTVELKPPAETRWYGWQTLAVDAVAVSSFAYGVEYERGELILGSLAVFVVVPPIVHLAHDRLGAAGGSLFLRLAVPALFTAVSLTTCSENEQGSCPQLAFYGAIAMGFAIASATDAIFLGREPVPRAQPMPPRATLVPMPSLRVDSKGARAAVTVPF
jgi:hypothetical protein